MRGPLIIAALFGALALGCDRQEVASSPDDSTPSPTSVASGRPAPPEPAARTTPAEIEPLSPELTALFRLIEAGRPDVARVRLRNHMNDHGDSAQSRFLFGLSYHREKRYELARPEFERAIELDANYYTTHHFYGWCLYYVGEPAAAREAFETFLEYDPTEADSHFALGLIAHDDGRSDDAEAEFRRSIELHESTSEAAARARDIAKAHARLGDVYLSRGDLENARAELVLATGMYPDHYEAFHKLATVLRRLGDDDGAAQALEKYEEAKARVRPGG